VFLPAVIALLGLSAASGITYVNLRASRYRDKLYGSIVRSVKARMGGEDAKPLSDRPGYSNLLRDDNDFGVAHQSVHQWVGELQEPYSLEPEIVKLFKPVSNPRPPPKAYSWFDKGHDNKAVIGSSTVLSTLMLLVLAVGPPQPPTSLSATACVVAVVGLSTILGHIRFGSKHLVDAYGKSFDKQLESILVKLGTFNAGESGKYLGITDGRLVPSVPQAAGGAS